MGDKCLTCGRFLSVVTWYSNDHCDSEDWSYRCSKGCKQLVEEPIEPESPVLGVHKRKKKK